MNQTTDSGLQLNAITHSLPHQAGRQIPALGSVLRGVGPLPRAALFLGMAADQLPVLLNLADPVPGPVLIAGDSGSGKTRLLQLIAEVVSQTHDPDTLRFVVIAERPAEWDSLTPSPNCEGILSFHEALTTNYLSSLVNWAHTNKHSDQYVLLLIDGLEGLQADESLHQSVRWLLLRGPSRRIWPIVTVKATRASAVNQWLPAFRTRLCGHIAADRDLAPLAGPTGASFDSLAPGAEFAMREGRDWLPFWIPRTD